MGRGRRLLRFRDMPAHLRFNPHIRAGYRPLQGVRGCLASLFYLHNETINILTHGAPILYIIVSWPDLIPWNEVDSYFLSWCHLLGAGCPWIGSFIYHLFMNLEHGEKIYYRLLQLDMLGIWISQSIGALPAISASTYCLPRLCRYVIVCFYCVLSIWGLYKALTAWSPWERRLCFLLPFVMRQFLCLLRMSPIGGGDPATLIHVILQDLVSAIGGIIGALQIPEKWFPGAVDMCLNSHNIMHILVLTAVYSMHKSSISDLMWMAKGGCQRHSMDTDIQTSSDLPATDAGAAAG
ncbi:progestin and adipoQ receptor family member 4 [Schistocerca nitens]|uniref:progestin and adipoQ receptor family member 4 n=2 Tax=Schistocerca TaxID=7008 RepID=UPI002118B886|nr:progestin and adipoQ receptor family member 4 isoform X1 [Schistocerca cancellata]XP_049790503.1 progestin and adipoQ receptor family member 4 [Schistocerca nitens]